MSIIQTNRPETPQSLSRWATELELLKSFRSRSISPEFERATQSERAALRTLNTLGILESTDQGVSAHPEGPLVIAAEVSASGYRIALADVSGRHTNTHIEPLPSTGERWLQRLTTQVAHAITEHGKRIIGVTVSVPATVVDNTHAEPAFLGWHPLDFTELRNAIAPLPLIVENNASLAALVEARQLCAERPESRVVLYLDLNSNIGGALLVDGETVVGSTGTAGEFGHMPYGDYSLACRCGAIGCWGTAVSGDGLAEVLGLSRPDNPIRFLSDAIQTAMGEDLTVSLAARAHPDSSIIRDRMVRGVSEIARRFGRGLGGLTNAIAPDTVILAGFAAQLHRAASQSFEQAFTDALMRPRRLSPPEIFYSRRAGDASLEGAALVALEHALTGALLDCWEEKVSLAPGC